MAEDFAEERARLVQEIAAYAFHTGERTGRKSFDARVMDAIGRVPRHEFVPAEIRPYAHSDGPLPIGWDKTISQPFIAALMTELLDVQPHHVVLEIGTEQ